MQEANSAGYSSSARVVGQTQRPFFNYKCSAYIRGFIPNPLYDDAGYLGIGIGPGQGGATADNMVIDNNGNVSCIGSLSVAGAFKH